MMRRTAVGIAAALALAGGLAWRLHVVQHEPRFMLSSRVLQLMYNRMLALRVQQYARASGRPAYNLDSVQVNLDSADASLVASLRTDVWGRPVTYFWQRCFFIVSSEEHLERRMKDVPPVPDSARRGFPIFRRGELIERFGWPAGSSWLRNC